MIKPTDYNENQKDKEIQLDANYGNGEVVMRDVKMVNGKLGKTGFPMNEYKPKKF